MSSDLRAQQLMPNMGVLHVGELMQLEVAAGLGIGAVALSQAIRLLLGTRGTCDSYA